MYNTTAATFNPDEFNSNYMPVGINENVTLKEVNVKKSTNGKDFLEIIFENDKGQTASMSEWKNEKNQWIKTNEDLQNRDNAQFGRLLSIIECFYPQGIEDTTLNTFAEMINWVKSKLDPMIATKKALRLKVIYDKRGYTTVSNNGVFVELKDVEKSQMKLFKRDLLERPVKADVESTDPLVAAANEAIALNTPVNSEIGSAHVSNMNDLPF